MTSTKAMRVVVLAAQTTCADGHRPLSFFVDRNTVIARGEIDIDLAFYWFTINAAPAQDMHWMIRDQADHFGVTTAPSALLGDAQTCDLRLRKKTGPEGPA